MRIRSRALILQLLAGGLRKRYANPACKILNETVLLGLFRSIDGSTNLFNVKNEAEVLHC